MPYDANKHLVNHVGQPVTIYAGQDDIELKVRGIPWSLKNQFASQAIQWEESGSRSFNIDEYVKQCLKYMIMEAPWGETNEMFLSRVGDELGAALQELVPTAFSNNNIASNVEDIKKEQSTS